MDNIINNEGLLHALKMISPGTPLRKGIENVLRAKTGGLIVLDSNEEVMKIVDGGFRINAEYSPAYLYELAKMDGAIVLSEDSKRILLANTQLIPNYNIPTTETGTRHRTAERVARQTGAIVISISQRRNVITVYRGEQKYVVEEISEVFSKANQALQTLQKYKDVLDTCIYNLNSLEFSDLATIYDVIVVVQSMERVMRVAQIIEGYLVNLGEEGYLVRMQLEELLGGTEKNRLLLLKDYKKENIDLEECNKKIRSLTEEDLLNKVKIAKVLGYSGISEDMDLQVQTKGYRILNKVHRLPASIIENLVNYFGNFQEILHASIEELDEVEGIGEIRATYIRNGLIKLKLVLGYGHILYGIGIINLNLNQRNRIFKGVTL